MLRTDAAPFEAARQFRVGCVVPERIVVDIAGEVRRDDHGADLDDHTGSWTLTVHGDAATAGGAHDDRRNGLTLAGQLELRRDECPRLIGRDETDADALDAVGKLDGEVRSAPTGLRVAITASQVRRR